MKIELEQVSPHEIEKRSFEIITEELNGRTFPEDQELVVKRCIHTSADFDYAKTMTYSPHAVGNAPTALVRLYELIGEGKIKPALIIGVPVGFVNVVQSKELIMQTNIPYIVARGRKGGSNIAACICNALLYMMDQDRGY